VLSSALLPLIMSIFCADDHAYADPATARTRRKRETPVSARVLLRMCELLSIECARSLRGRRCRKLATGSTTLAAGLQPAGMRFQSGSGGGLLPT
jgi:hypothetical protein